VPLFEIDSAKPGWLITEIEYRDRDLIRQVPGARQVLGRISGWRVPLSWVSSLALRGIFGDRLEIGPAFGEWAWREYSERVEPATTARELALDPANDCAGNPLLWNFQRTGSEFLYTSRGAILGDDMGTGKTALMIDALERLDAYPVLIVALKVAKKSVWAKHFATWTPHRTVTVVDSTGVKKARQMAADTDVVITNYESLRGGSRLAHYGNTRLTDKEKTPGPLNRPWSSVVADEAHKAKDPHSKQTRALWGVRQTAKYAFAMTGTPGGPEDLWSLLHFVAPDEWPSKSSYIDRYCTVEHAWHGGVNITGFREDTKEELFSSVNARFLRRPQELVLPNLPEKLYQTRFVEMTPKQRTAYKDMETRQVAELNGGITGAFNGLTRLTRLSQFASAHAELIADGEDEEGRPKQKVVLSEPSSKCDDAMEFMEEAGNRPVGIFAESKQLINLLAARFDKAGISYGRVTGDDNQKKRDQDIEDFQAGKLRAMLLTVAAGGASIDLTRASLAYFMQRSFSWENDRQAEKRFHRPGQKSSVLVIDCITPGTVEETVVFPTLKEKTDLYEQVVRDKEIMRRIIGG
jgi:SNF2 family DNA or RNA helicase